MKLRLLVPALARAGAAGHVPAGHVAQFRMHERGHDGEGFL